jgi:glycine dehydrogenase subunit 2
VVELLDAVHEAGALAYMDGANMNAVLGRFRPGAAGFDVMHFNLHKTFSTPHGGGGPGAGLRRLRARRPPAPPLAIAGPTELPPERDDERPTSIGRMRAYQGSTGILVRAFAYILSTVAAPAGERRRCPGGELPPQARRRGLRAASRVPCARVRGRSGRAIKEATGVRTLDIAKRLIDHGYHPPTIYFPLIVEECLLIEPTETESIETLYAFADALIAVAAEAHDDPELLLTAPHDAPVRRLDEATAARQPDLRWQPLTGLQAPCPQ